MDIVFVDSCVVIDFSKNNSCVTDRLSQIQSPCLNFIVEMELLQGARNKRDLIAIQQKLESFSLLKLAPEIETLSTKLITTFNLSHGLTIGDAVIAATCLTYDIPLWTYNLKDFKYIPGVELI